MTGEQLGTRCEQLASAFVTDPVARLDLAMRILELVSEVVTERHKAVCDLMVKNVTKALESPAHGDRLDEVLQVQVGRVG